MTARQTILEIVEDSPNQEIMIDRLIDFVYSEQDRHFSMGQRAKRHADHSLEALIRNQHKAASTLA